MKLISYHWDCERFQIEAHITHIIYAVRSADVATAPVKLKLVGEVAAGHPFRGKVEAGEAARIFTGGVLPPGADTIVIQENTVRDGDAVVITKGSSKGKQFAAGWLRHRWIAHRTSNSFEHSPFF